MIGVSQIHQCIRLWSEGVPIRTIAREVGVARNTVRRYIRGAEPGKYKLVGERPAPVQEKCRALVRQFLTDEKDLETPRKQRLTGARIHELLAEADVRASARTVRTVVKSVRNELRDVLKHAYLPLEYDPGEDAQVDFGESQIVNRKTGEKEKVFVLIVIACYSGRAFRCVTPNQTQEALLESLIRAMHFFGGMFRTWWFDNLTPAVRKVLASRGRVLQPRFEAFLAHYGINAEFCAPGKGNEKGMAEGDVKFSRRNALSPMPIVESWREVQPLLDKRAVKDLGRSRAGSTIGELWEHDRSALLPLRAHDFEVGLVSSRTVTKRSWIQIGTNFYSVPVALVGETVSVRTTSDEVVILFKGAKVGEHERLQGRERSSLKIEHYLPLLQRKSRGIDRSIPVRRWLEKVPGEWKLLLSLLRKSEGEVAGSKSFIDIVEIAQRRGLTETTEAIRRTVQSERPSVATVRFHLGHAEESTSPKLNFAGPKALHGSPSDYAEVHYA